MKIYWPLVIFLPLIGCTAQVEVVQPRPRAPLVSPPPADGIMFVPVKKTR